MFSKNKAAYSIENHEADSGSTPDESKMGYSGAIFRRNTYMSPRHRGWWTVGVTAPVCIAVASGHKCSYRPREAKNDADDIERNYNDSDTALTVLPGRQQAL